MVTLIKLNTNSFIVASHLPSAASAQLVDAVQAWLFLCVFVFIVESSPRSFIWFALQEMIGQNVNMRVLIYLLFLVLLGLILRRGKLAPCNHSSHRCILEPHDLKLILRVVRAWLNECVLLLWGPNLAASVLGRLLLLVEHRVHASTDLPLLG